MNAQDMINAIRAALTTYAKANGLTFVAAGHQFVDNATVRWNVLTLVQMQAISNPYADRA